MRQNLVEQKFGRLLVIGEAGKNKSGNMRWLCRCVCGVEKMVVGSDLKFGRTKSCGCLRRQLVAERFTTHGKSGTPEYAAWKGAKERCTNPNYEHFYDYGGRGIEFRLPDFAEFLAHIGPRPSSNHSLDRIDNLGHYQIGNIRWATQETQNRNRRSTRHLTYKGESLCVTDWAGRLGFNYNTIHKRLRLGWSVERTLSTPVRGSL